jgi:NAD(P)-dependent dehydrogenase (short-subunit alcohol dehydrogenase family)
MRAFVTGGSRGIGRAAALALAEAGADVAVGYVSRDDDARATAEACGGIALRGDLADDPAAVVDAAAERLGGLDAFVHCAVEPIRRPILELTADDFDRTMRLNARPFVLGAAAAARLMTGGGRIVALSATGGHRIRNPAYAPLGIAKGAVEAAVRFLAVDLAPRGITVNAIAPGPTRTEAFDAMATDAPALRDRFASLTPMGRMGEPADAARLIAFLCSPEAGWVTGQLIFSDGGYSLA